MNKVILIGRLTADPTLRTTNTDKKVANYTLAVDRTVAKEAEKQSDFIRCLAWNKSAEFAEKYLKKGMKIAVCGRLQTGSYDDKDGKKVYTTDVVVEQHDFCEKRAGSASDNGAPTSPDDFMTIPPNIDEEIPFN